MSNNNELTMMKQSLRIPYDDDDLLITSLHNTSKEYVKNAVDSTLEASSEFFKEELYTNATMLLTQYWYLNRGEATTDHIPVYVLSMIQQLRGKY